MDAFQKGVDRHETRLRIAEELARHQLDAWGCDDDVVVRDDTPVESVDGGYWVEALVWVGAEEVEDELANMDALANAIHGIEIEVGDKVRDTLNDVTLTVVAVRERTGVNVVTLSDPSPHVPNQVVAATDLVAPRFQKEA